jgi:GrpB-like predicted nucleotidyltransferase (UPF0157 family)
MVTIVPYKSSWPGEFQELAKILRASLGILALRIDHIGSTSVRGLAAKDRIDIQITVANLDSSVEEALNKVGYQRLKHLRDHPPSGMEAGAGEWSKWVFKPPVDQRPTNLHVRVAGRPNQRYALLFRDYLRTHPATAEAYAELKSRLAQNLADPNTYPDVKDPAVDLIYLAAEDWAKATGWGPGPSDA